MSGLTLPGRRSECDVLDGLVRSARAGRGAVLMVRGEAGIGKSALLGHLANAAAGCRVVRIAGVKSQMQFSFASLEQLCSPMLTAWQRLPPVQADALAATLGMRTGSPDKILVGSAVHTLMSEVADDQPLICLVDDAQWLDPASAEILRFVAGQLVTEPVVLVLAMRTGQAERLWAGLPQLTVRGLSRIDASKLLESAVIRPLDKRVCDRLLAESRGNPRALSELPQRLSPTELTFGTAPIGPGSGTSPCHEEFRDQLQQLPKESLRLLVLAAAEPLGDVGLLWRAVEWLGMDPDAAVLPEAAGLIEFHDTVRFRHPLLRSVAYWRASWWERKLVHRALAEATMPELDPDRRAWHMAQATSGLDEDVAAALERSVDRARAHGGVTAAAILLERAAAITPHAADRARRQVNAAHAMMHAGMVEGAANLVVLAERGPLNALQRARVDVLRAQLRLSSDQRDGTLRSLVTSVRRLECLDAGLAVDGYLDALAAALSAGRMSGPGALDIVSAAGSARMPTFQGREATLLQAIVMQLTGDLSAAAPLMRRAVQAFDGAELHAEEGLRLLWLASISAVGLWDFKAWEALSERHLNMARNSGALGVLSLALNARVYTDLFAGDLRSATSRVEEIHLTDEAADSRLPPYGAMALAAFRGHEKDAAPLIALVWKDAGADGEGAAKAAAKWAEALMCNGLGRYARALRAGFEAAEHALGLGPSSWGLVEMIEGAVRAGDRPVAVAGSRRLSDMAAAGGTGWALGVAARSSALLAEGPRARSLFLEAIDHLGEAGVRVEVARARLLYGEWLRREGRRREARDQLSVAYDVLSAAGVDAFAYRARRELAATGEHVRRRTADARQGLTAQELNIARLAAVGLSNPDIGAELFISSRTVEWHMGKVLAKLGITARRQLGEALQASSSGHEDGMRRPLTGNVFLSDASAAEHRGSPVPRRFG